MNKEKNRQQEILTLKEAKDYQKLKKVLTRDLTECYTIIIFWIGLIIGACLFNEDSPIQFAFKVIYALFAMGSFFHTLMAIYGIKKDVNGLRWVKNIHLKKGGKDK